MKTINKWQSRSTKSKVAIGVVVALVTGAVGYITWHASNASSYAQQPAGDVASQNVVGVGHSATALYKNVNDGTSFSSADDNASYIRGENGVDTAYNTVSFSVNGSDTGQHVNPTVNYRAYKGSASSGSIQVQVYNNDHLWGTGPEHSLTSSYQNFSDKFNNVTFSPGQVRVKVILRNKGDSGGVRYTQLWIDSTISGTPTPPPPVTPPPTPPPVTPPPVTPPQTDIVRAAFYYPWFPQTWGQGSTFPFTNYHPTLGYYSSDDTAVLASHVKSMVYAHLNSAISSWWGQGQQSEQTRFPKQLAAADGTGFKWTLYYEKEGFGDPSVSEITGDLNYIKSHYTSNANYLKIGSKPVIFVYGDASDGCSMADRWKQANAAVGSAFFVDLKVFPGYQNCASQPNSWHQYGPAVATDDVTGYSYGISPGFWKKGEATPRLARDLTRWSANLKSMLASNEKIQLVQTFSEWGEGTAVESASEWATASGQGAYLDAMHNILPASTIGTPTPPPPPTSGDPVIAAAGDIACDPTDPSFAGTATACQMRATASLLANINPTKVLALGDLQYETGSLANFNNSFALSWGAQKAKISPAIGNHEGGEGGSNAGYFDYFNGVGVANGAAGDRTKGYYSYNVGNWHLIALNSNCGSYIFNGSTTGCQAGSPQETWLKADLAAHPGVCTLAYWHVPRFSSGSSHPNSAATDTVYTPFWNDLSAAGADIVLNGHDHDYERFQPLSPNGAVDSQHGVTEFVVGTGGRNQYTFTTPVNGSAVRATGFGVLKLTLHAKSYDWQFVDAPGSTITDSGTAACHTGGVTPPPVDTQAPTAPTGLASGAVSSSSVALSWKASTDNVKVNAYHVYRDGKVVGSVSGTTLNFTDTTVLPSTTYSYQVTALDLAGNESAASTAVSVKTSATSVVDTQPPSTPGSLTGTVLSSTQINLAWSPSVDNVGVAGYDVYRNGALVAGSISSTTYGDTAVSAGHTYTYTVKARDAAGNVSPAATVAVTIPASPPPPPPPPPGTGPCGTTTTAPSQYKHVIWIWMENHSYSGVIGNSAAPYQTNLAKECATNKAMKDAGSQYNSLSNYIAGTTGLDSCSGGSGCNGNSTWDDCGFNPTSCSSPNDNIFRQVRAKGGTAKSFEEGMSGNCSTSGSDYATKHNPQVYFVGGTDRAACATDDVPMGTTSGGNFLSALASDSTLPTFSFVTPTLCNDTHDCGVATGDAWLKSWVDIILASPAYKSGDTALAIWYDEDTPIPNVVIAPSVKAVSLNDSSYSHYSLLRSTEEMLGLPFIGKASTAPSFRAAYNL